MKNQILTLIIGILIGAIATTGVFLFIKSKDKNKIPAMNVNSNFEERKMTNMDRNSNFEERRMKNRDNRE